MERGFLPKLDDVEFQAFGQGLNKVDFQTKLTAYEQTIEKFLRENAVLEYPYTDSIMTYMKHCAFLDEMDRRACLVATKRFIREVAIARMDVTGVIRGLDFGIPDRGEFFHAIEMLPYGSLDNFTIDGIRSLKQEIRETDGATRYVPYDFDYCDLFIWMHRIFSTLDRFFHNKLIHRDIKPETIVINRALLPVIGELESARQYAEGQTSAGTLYWAAPEVVQAALEQGKKDQHPASVFKTHAKQEADIYSAALVCYHLCLGNYRESEWDVSVDGVEEREELRKDCFSRLDIKNVSETSRKLADIDTSKEEGSQRFSLLANETMRELITRNCGKAENRMHASDITTKLELLLNELMDNSRRTAEWYEREHPGTKQAQLFLEKAQEYRRKWSRYMSCIMRPAPAEGSLEDMETAARCGSLTAMGIMFLYRVKNNINNKMMDTELAERLVRIRCETACGFGANLLDGFPGEFALDVMDQLRDCKTLTNDQKRVREQCALICEMLHCN